MNEFKIRKAGPEDVGLVLSFIRQLAEYEKMLEEVTAIFPPFWGFRGCMWRMYSSSRTIEAKDMARRCFVTWPKLLWKKTVDGWNGPAWTGTSRPCVSITILEQSPWISGRCSG